jgi:hypothetical protein
MQKMIITLVFKKNANFLPKMGTMAENCNHNIDPRAWPLFAIYQVGEFFVGQEGGLPLLLDLVDPGLRGGLVVLLQEGDGAPGTEFALLKIFLHGQ